MQVPENSSLRSKISDHSWALGRVRWQLLPQFLMRQSGFPIEWLDELSFKEVSDAAIELLNCYAVLQETRLDALQSLQDILPARTGSKFTLLNQSLLELHARLEKWALVRPFVIQVLVQDNTSKDLVKRAIAWNADLKRINSLHESYTYLYVQDAEQAALRVLRRYCYNERLREVLLLSNEANFDLFDYWLESHKELTSTQSFKSSDRRKIDMLIMYLQRVCTKNETNSHFGPFSLGRIIPEKQGIQWDGEGPPQRVAFFAYWAANELAQKMSHDPELSRWLRPRRIPCSFIENNHLRILDYEQDTWFGIENLGSIRMLPLQSLSPEEVALLEACDGERTLQVLFEWWQQMSPEETWKAFRAILESLERRGALVTAFEVPTGTINALDDLRTMLPLTEEASAPWLEILDAFKETLQQFATAGDLLSRRRVFTKLKNQFTSLTSAASSRGFGVTYADRSILYEECRRDLRGLSLGGYLAHTIKDDLTLFYDLKLLVPRYELAAQRKMLNNWFVDRFGLGQQISAEAFLATLSADAPLLENHYAGIDVEIEAIRKIIDDTLLPQSSVNEATFEVTPDALRKLVKLYQVPPTGVCNPDVMVIAPSLEAIHEGKFQVLVADWHADCEILSHTSLSPFIAAVFPDFANDVITSYRTLIEEDEEIVDVIRYHTDKISAQLALACPDLEMRGRSPKPCQNVLALRDLAVHQTSKGLRLYAPLLQKFVRLMVQDIFSWVRWNPFNIFGFPRHIPGLVIQGSGRDHIPRIVMNRVVIQRELWRIPTSFFSDPISLGHKRLDTDSTGDFLRAKRLQATLGLPRYVFAKIPKEPKPIYIDFDAPLLTRQLVRLSKHVHGTIEFSEMLPAHNDLWLQDGTGHYTSEFRFAAFSPLKHEVSQKLGEDRREN